jgi:hypothetical protein
MPQKQRIVAGLIPATRQGTFLFVAHRVVFVQYGSICFAYRSVVSINDILSSRYFIYFEK